MERRSNLENEIFCNDHHLTISLFLVNKTLGSQVKGKIQNRKLFFSFAINLNQMKEHHYRKAVLNNTFSTIHCEYLSNVASIPWIWVKPSLSSTHGNKAWLNCSRLVSKVTRWVFKIKTRKQSPFSILGLQNLNIKSKMQRPSLKKCKIYWKKFWYAS